MVQALGRSHPTIRRIRELRRDGGRRRAEGVFVAEGLRLVEEALAAAAELELALFSPRLASSAAGRRVLGRLRAARLPCFETADTVMDGLQDARSPQPALVVARRPSRTVDGVLASAGRAPLLLVAHGIQDPGNLGSLLRTADAAGAAGAFVTGRGADPYHPRAVRATMGSIFRLPVVTADASDLLERLGRAGVACCGADPASATDYDRTDWSGSCAIFLGRETDGLPKDLLAALDHRLRIPMREGVDSLSVGAAGAVLLFAAARRRALSPG